MDTMTMNQAFTWVVLPKTKTKNKTKTKQNKTIHSLSPSQNQKSIDYCKNECEQFHLISLRQPYLTNSKTQGVKISVISLSFL